MAGKIPLSLQNSLSLEKFASELCMDLLEKHNKSIELKDKIAELELTIQQVKYGPLIKTYRLVQ